MSNILTRHLITGVTSYTIFASLDIWLTLEGIQGDIALEGNPIMKYMMENF